MQIGSRGRGAMVVLFYSKLPQLWEISLFRKESAACDGNSRQRFSQLITPIALGVSLKSFSRYFRSHMLKLIYIFWPRSYSKQSLLWRLLGEKTCSTVYFS